MKILMTNNNLLMRSGSELYVKEVAEELIRRGHIVAAYSTHVVGELGKLMNQFGIQTTDDLAELSWTPDIIHGQHHLETMTALAYFPNVPAIYICHGWKPWQEAPPLHPRIIEYAAVDKLTLQHAIEDHHIIPDKIRLIHNFVDLDRFKQRVPLPPKPKKALVFSNYANEGNYLPLVRQACFKANIELEVIGFSSGHQVDKPEDVLKKYDLIFAVGRSAFEALATGSAVVICGEWGVGPMVTAQNMRELYDLNFGVAAMYSRPDADVIYSEIGHYNADDSAILTKNLRAMIDIRQAVEVIEKIYIEAVGKFKNAKIKPEDEARAFSDYLKNISLLLKKKYQEVQEKHPKIFSANLTIGQKDQELFGLSQAIQQKEQEVKKMTQEVSFIKSSKFWKLREQYLKLRKTIF